MFDVIFVSYIVVDIINITTSILLVPLAPFIIYTYIVLLYTDKTPFPKTSHQPAPFCRELAYFLFINFFFGVLLSFFFFVLLPFPFPRVDCCLNFCVSFIFYLFFPFLFFPISIASRYCIYTGCCVRKFTAHATTCTGIILKLVFPKIG